MYEFSTEALFFGRQDAMQRTSLLPLAQHIRDRGLDPSQMKVLEACCGTGRFHTFLKVSAEPDAQLVLGWWDYSSLASWVGCCLWPSSGRRSGTYGHDA